MNREEGLKTIFGYRDRIDELDRKLVALLNNRTRIVEKLGRIKQELEMPVYEPKREDQVYRNIVENNSGPLPPEALKRLFERIVDEMRSLQHMNRKTRQDESAPDG